MPLNVVQYAGTGGASGTVPTAEAPALKSEDVATAGSTTTEVTCGLVRLVATVNMRVKFGTGAGATDEFFPANVVEWRVVRGKMPISAVNA